jgi:cell division septation protein DedD
MRGVFDDEEPEPYQPRRDTELTLGSTTLLVIFFGLVLLCGLCFGLGYAVGHHGSQQPTEAMQPATGAQTTLQADGSRPKPSAIASSGAAPQRQSVVVEQVGDQAVSATSSANPNANSRTGENVAQGGSSLGQSQIRAALPAAANPTQPAAASRVQPALTPAVPLLVQIAAVSHQEDADVLVSALRKRGYAVVARREAADGLIHVHIGPFNSRDIVNRWRQKLLGDGYNAVVQP